MLLRFDCEMLFLLKKLLVHAAGASVVHKDAALLVDATGTTEVARKVAASSQVHANSSGEN